MRILVTGGAGFIGSHLVDALMEKDLEVVVIDNLSRGSIGNLRRWLQHPKFMFIKGDLKNPEDTFQAIKGCETVFHLAANPEVRVGSVSPDVHFQQNVIATYNLLEALRVAGNVKTLVFTSSSTVYGEAEVPTPENYSPLKPISVYGASKLACEALISAYAYSYGFKAVIYRLANIVGPRSRHGVIIDFVRKLKENPRELEILGDGSQRKSYLYIDDCIDAMLLGLKKVASSNNNVEIFNVGSDDQVDVLTIARIVVEEMGLKDVKFRLTGGVDGGRGWVGDVKNMLLDVGKLKFLGWKPRYNSEEAVRVAAKLLLESSYDFRF
ncbi:UDP-glucose 4-epimerase [Candidatus Bathyarchaeota archaeon]|nr:MAG: UDP-glucose 4-epimerase [Candidatus Bathyarchaeota archaeon]